MDASGDDHVLRSHHDAQALVAKTNSLDRASYLLLSPDGATAWVDRPDAATAFAPMRDAARMAARLRAFGLPRGAELALT